MFKNTAAIILLLAFMAHTFNKAAIVVSYFANTTAYAKNCVNKAKPQLHCNGKCQVMKKLKQEEKKEAQNPDRNGSRQDEVLSSKSFFAAVQVIHIHTTNHFPDHAILLLQNRARDIFHPPGA